MYVCIILQYSIYVYHIVQYRVEYSMSVYVI